MQVTNTFGEPRSIPIHPDTVSLAGTTRSQWYEYAPVLASIPTILPVDLAPLLRRAVPRFSSLTIQLLPSRDPLTSARASYRSTTFHGRILGYRQQNRFGRRTS